MKAASSRSALFSIGLFFAVVFAWSWFFWFLVAALGVSVNTPLGSGLMHTGLLGPMLGNIGFADASQRRDAMDDCRAGPGLRTVSRGVGLARLCIGPVAGSFCSYGASRIGEKRLLWRMRSSFCAAFIV